MQTGSVKTGKLSKPGRLPAMAATACLLLALAWPCAALARPEPATGSGWFLRMDQYAAGAHGTLSCEVCHGEITGKGTPHPDKDAKDYLKKDIRRTYDYRTCGTCHKTAWERSLKGRHAEALQKELFEGKPSETGVAPNCGDCHTAHYSRSHESRTATGRQMVDSCGSCHPDQAESYLANFHGKAAVNLEYDGSAYCTDCHGAHTTVSLKNREVLVETCRRCHPKASDAFADIIIHDDIGKLDQKSDDKQSALKIVHWLGLLSLVFVSVLLVFFYAHTGLLMLRKLHEKLRR